MFKVGIIGAGKIARKMAKTLAAVNDMEVGAIASRSLEKAKAFADECNVKKAYGSYEELVDDADIDLVYIATPHSHHYDQALLTVNASKPVLVEKAFTANAHQAERLLTVAREKGVFITEAIWTRYMPLSLKIKEIVDSGIIGEPHLLTANLCYRVEDVARIVRPELCGGALLDLGVYAINFARMYFGNNVQKTVSNCILGATGMDMQESISLVYSGNKMANLLAGALCQSDRQGIISGTEGYIRVDSINCPRLVEVYRDYVLHAQYYCPEDIITGYEYEVLECKRCIEAGLLESPLMPHKETVSVMRQMDALRKEWGVRYPMDEE
ncbi:Gfo/Idh/MocA family protein [Prevotella sp. KH2C16]|uniref:Gfo/Idh/MocA family protein n=1 Tax=Prevotella sp. KH2C16 TaxID=1855325 RepID=UPI0008E20F34|nr:Gfo/Idh/MocA family oxidoreductase [Prevotella sp. KH2C16]SFF91475.1 Predicted dehydrogenase [Prevotella sp. KH2C16]